MENKTENGYKYPFETSDSAGELLKAVVLYISWGKNVSLPFFLVLVRLLGDNVSDNII